MIVANVNRANGFKDISAQIGWYMRACAATFRERSNLAIAFWSSNMRDTSLSSHHNLGFNV